MRITLVGSKHFGVTTLDMLKTHNVEIASVVVADAEDRLAAAAKAAGIPVTVQANPKLVVASEIAEGTELIITAHSHARIGKDALAAASLGGIGYHPSLLPRHRGIAAVEWTIKEGDPIAGGTIYHLADVMDGGAIAAQEWCFVKKAKLLANFGSARWRRWASSCSARSWTSRLSTSVCPQPTRTSNSRPMRQNWPRSLQNWLKRRRNPPESTKSVNKGNQFARRGLHPVSCFGSMRQRSKFWTHYPQ